MLAMNPMGKYITEKNTSPDNVPYLVDNKKCMCQHRKLHSLTSRKGECI